MTVLAAREKCLLAALDRILPRRQWSPQQMRQFQTSTLQALVAHAFENVPLYRDKYTAAGFHPSALRSLDDLPKIPLLTKEELRQAGSERVRSTDRPRPARLLASSGSSGIPIRIYREEDSLWHFTAHATALYYEWCDHQPLEEVLYFLDLTPDSIDYALADLLRTTAAEERLVSVEEPPAVLAAKIQEFRPQFISSYPSTLRNIAIWMHQRGQSYEGLRLLHVTSEMFDPRTRLLFGRVFPHARVVETYTSTEAGLMGCRCARDNRWHLTEDSVIGEIVDREGNATRGLGEIVVTDLTNWATPIIRYRGLGDYGRWDETGCSCGSVCRSIQHLEGRYTASLVLPDGTLQSPYPLTNALEEVSGVYQYQIIQRSVVEFEVLVVKDASGPCTESAIRSAIARAFRVLPKETGHQVRFVESIAPGAGRHKVPLVLSTVRGSS